MLRDYKVSDHFGVQKRPDTLSPSKVLVNSSLLTGIEIEMEGLYDPMRSSPKGWHVVPEGSIRNHGREYVLVEPLSGRNLSLSIRRLESGLRQMKWPPKFNLRTSLHVHLNFSDKTLEDALSFVVFYSIFEGLLFNMCKSHRENNIYSAPLWKFGSLHPIIIKSFKIPKNWALAEEHKYGAINIGALRKFGTIEIRCHQGTGVSEDIFQWLNTLYRVYDASKAAVIDGSLYDIPSILSSESPAGFAQRVLSRQYPGATKGLSSSDVERIILRGCRVGQHILYQSK